MAKSLQMVDTLWLFVLDYEVAVSFATPKEQTESGHPTTLLQGDVRESVYDDIDGGRANDCTDAFDLAGLMVLHCVTALLEILALPTVLFL